MVVTDGVNPRMVVVVVVVDDVLLVWLESSTESTVGASSVGSGGSVTGVRLDFVTTFTESA
ncbi:MAG: hypothetical protein ACO3V2_02205 [Ilumatobacteraceae bacterium]